ncbi:efflux RND transporter periplasmic adaptor subunit [Maridesulfovibrio hydrothermalis]|uniref:Efflux transporter, RND family, MFP subunit n=1 Tax=Maridesulfovibrio hydrothermalis AM13 = DSM 14728 TaxID=1121451 RepID=L0RD29_9BACT|nr:efflux RND transporter periplasmic adaptor subunit [Maridesulfovibrio hydrothermalis]CCO23441.1 Efflux transporter, RND family, MFP subunit [Maridesulfovibrio hydrothermalis AM13 = DSM 14728]
MMKKCILVALLGAAIMLMILWISGLFNSGMIEEGRVVPTRTTEAPAQTVQSQTAVVPVMYEAVGTVRPETEAAIEAQVTAKVVKVLVRSGNKVRKGDKLIVLDSRESQTRLESARQGLKSAEAARRQAGEAINAASAESATATATWKRMKILYESKVATRDELDRVEAAYLKARAGLAQARDGLEAASAAEKQARKAVEEAGINLGYTTITAPADGEVAKRMVETGDLAFPGKTLMLIQTGGSLRLEAQVREGVIGLVRTGQELEVEIQALDERTTGVVEEVVPSADPSTRTFLVKVGLKPLPGLYPGMFGRLLIPLRQKEIVLVPQKAVSRVGQLETVLVHTGAVWEPVYVRTGQVYDGNIEIVSGLRGNETIGMNVIAAGGES